MKSSVIILLALAALGATAQPASYSLEQLLDSARNNNNAVRAAQYNIAAAGEQRKEAFTRYFPNVSATGLWFGANKGMAQTSITPSELIPASLATTLAASMPVEALASLANPVSISMLKKGVVGGVTVMQPVFAGGQIVNGNRLAKVGEDVSRLQLRLARDEVDRTTEQYYWQLVTLQEKVKTIAAVEAMLADIHKDVSVAVRAGLILRNDLLQVELRQNDIESQKLKLNNGIGITKLLLAQYCGLIDTAFTLTAVPVHEAVLPVKQNHGQALLNTAEYQLLDKQVEASRLQKDLAVGKNMPTVAVGAGYNYHNLLDRGHHFGMIFATVSVPISDWWGGSHAIKRKKIEHLMALDEQQDKAELLQIRMLNAWNSVVEAQQQLDIAGRGIEQAQENLRVHRDLYRAGTCRMSDLLEAQMLYQQACDKRTDAYAALQTRLLDYRQSTGQ